MTRAPGYLLRRGSGGGRRGAVRAVGRGRSARAGGGSARCRRGGVDRGVAAVAWRGVRRVRRCSGVACRGGQAGAGAPGRRGGPGRGGPRRRDGRGAGRGAGRADRPAPGARGAVGPVDAGAVPRRAAGRRSGRVPPRPRGPGRQFRGGSLAGARRDPPADPGSRRRAASLARHRAARRHGRPPGAACRRRCPRSPAAAASWPTWTRCWPNTGSSSAEHARRSPPCPARPGWARRRWPSAGRTGSPTGSRTGSCTSTCAATTPTSR